MNPVLLGRGAKDTRKQFFSDGRANPKGLQPWGTLTIQELYHRLQNPQSVPKHEGDWMIPSDYIQWDGRRFAVQEEKGYFWFLVVDIDHGNHMAEQVRAAIHTVLGDAYFLMYETYSSKDPEKGGGYRWRVLVPLLKPLIGAAYQPTVLALRELLTRLGGLAHADKTSSRFAQISYLPNKGAYSYSWHEGGSFLLDPSQNEVLGYEAMRQFHQLSSKGTNQDGNEVAEHMWTFRWNFNRHFPVDELLSLYGATVDGRGPNGEELWRLPGQTAKGSLIILPDEKWTTFSGEAAKHIGFTNSKGQQQGDAYDLAIHYTFHGNTEAATTVAKAIQYGAIPQSIDPYYAIEPATNCLAYHTAEGAAIYQHYREAQDRWKADPNSLPSPEVQEPVNVPEGAIMDFQQQDLSYPYSKVPSPSRSLHTVARWLYDEVMYDQSWDAAVTTAWLLSMAVVGRKDSWGSTSPRFFVSVFGINGFGKDTVRAAINALVEDFKRRRGTQISPMMLPVIDNFAGPNRSFGLTKHVKTMLNSVSSLMVWSEAGKASQSQAGDSASITAGVMQDISQDAYSRSHYRAANEITAQPYAVNSVRVIESTKEAFTDFMTSDNITSGAVARELTVMFDVSRQEGESRMTVNRTHIPDAVATWFARMVDEAVDGEEVVVGGDGKPVGVSANPVFEDMRRVYTLAPDVQPLVDKLMQERRDFRRANTGNEASMEWALKVRYPQQLSRLMLLRARTEWVANANPSAPRLITMQDFLDAKAFLDESCRVQLANESDYNSALDQLAEAMKATAGRVLDKPNGRYMDHLKHPAGTTVASKQITADIAAEKRFFPLSYFTYGRCKKCKRLVDKITSQPGRFMNATSGSVYRVVLHDFDGTLWHLDTSGQYGPGFIVP